MKTTKNGNHGWMVDFSNDIRVTFNTDKSGKWGFSVFNKKTGEIFEKYHFEHNTKKSAMREFVLLSPLYPIDSVEIK